MAQLTIEFSLAEARNQKAAVLKMLIEMNGVSERDTVFNGFRMRITELKRIPGLNIRTAREDFTTQFGKRSHYNVHYLMDCDKEAARELYEKINR